MPRGRMIRGQLRGNLAVSLDKASRMGIPELEEYIAESIGADPNSAHLIGVAVNTEVAVLTFEAFGCYPREDGARFTAREASR